MTFIFGGLTGGLVVGSIRVAKPNWDWADRVMARLFGGRDGSDEKA